MQQATCKTDRGRQRTINEDSLLCMKTEHFYVVADGVGGHNSGELASSMAIEFIEAYIKTNPIGSISGDFALMTYFLNCLREVNSLIFKRAFQVKENAGMATTVAMLYIGSGKAYVVNVGDSRVYLARDGQLLQVTEDHSYVNELLKKGTITREEAENHPERNMITRALGSEEKVEPDFYQFQVYKGDRILLCTDGLYNEVQEEEISEISKIAIDTQVMAQELIERANEYGGRDNISVICVEIEV